MNRSILTGAVALFAAAAPLHGQSLASRVAQAPDGVVRMEVESRAGVCGDGREMVGYRQALFGRNFQTFGRWSGVRCEPGPLRISLTVAGDDVRELRTQVGGDWPPTGARVTDLGVVPPAEASAYFFSIVPRLERGKREDRVLIPAVLADAGSVTEPLFALVRDPARDDDVRRSAIFWMALLGDRDAFARLRDFYTRSDDDLKDALMHAMSLDEVDGGRWLIARTQDDRETRKARKSAFFWAGQREETPTSELVRVNRGFRDQELREHGIFVLSQRKDDAAVEELMRIAREDRDTEMRGKALFWLAQNDDPRVRKLLADLILK
jgi:hypothetical protein